MFTNSARSLNETMVVGTKDELNILVEKLIAGCGEVNCDLVPIEERRDNIALKSIRVVTHSNSKLDIQVQGETVIISGAIGYLKVLAENIRTLANEERAPAHWHCDYYPGHPFLQESARQLIFELA